MDDLWINDVSLLYRDGRYRLLFPTRGMSVNERVNSLVRLLLLAMLCLYLYNRDARYVLLGVVSIAMLTTVTVMGGGRQNYRLASNGRPICTHPTPDNPFANVLLTDYKYNANRPPACNVDDVANEIQTAYDATTYRNAGDFSRNTPLERFYTNPDTTTWQQGREAFAEAVYGTGPTCKEQQFKCTGY